MSSGIANANPTPAVERIGSDAPGTVTDAESFTQFLESEDAGAKAPRRERNPKPAKRAPEEGSDGEAEEGDEKRPATERQPKRERERTPEADEARDPVLDADAPPKDDSDDADEDDGDDDGTDEGEDADEGDDTDDDGDEGEDPEFPVMVNGVSQRVKLSDLTAAYSQNLDYTGKTTALANERREFETVRTETAQQRDNYVKGMQVFQDLISSVMPSQAEWDALKQSDPKAFIAAQEQWGGFLGKVEAAQAERDRVQEEQNQENAQKFRDYAKAEDAALFDKLPQLRNPEVMKQFHGAIVGYARKMGYSDDQIRGLVNHRDIMTAYYASRYMQILESRKANRSTETRNKPKASEGNSNARTAQTPRGRRAARNNSEQRRADRRLAETGNIRDAANSFAAMFRD